MRAPFQVIVFPYRFIPANQPEYLILFRKTVRFGDFWQAISGGGEDDETPLQAAIRETEEETGLTPNAPFFRLEMMSMLPANVATNQMLWGPDVLVVPEYAFAVQVGQDPIQISAEHDEYRWCTYEQAQELLLWDSNRNALWELNYRIEHKMPPHD